MSVEIQLKLMALVSYTYSFQLQMVTVTEHSSLAYAATFTLQYYIIYHQFTAVAHRHAAVKQVGRAILHLLRKQEMCHCLDSHRLSKT